MNDRLNDIDPNAFEFLTGKVLTAVTFVWNYYQLLLDTDTLSIYTNPAVIYEGKVSTLSNPGYRDALCARIGARVIRAINKRAGLSLEFSDGSSFEISLEAADRVTPELQESLLVMNPNGTILSVGDSEPTDLDKVIGISRVKKS
jgi:hypothetical protein